MPDACIGRIFFRSQQLNTSTGWQETIGINGTPDVALPLLNTLAEARAQMLGNGVFIQSIMCSNVAVLNDSLTQPGPPPQNNGGQFYYNANYMDVSADFSDRTVLCRILGTDILFKTRRSYQVHGAPDSLMTINQLTITNANWITSFNAWAAVLKNGAFGIFTTVNTANAPKTITQVAIGQTAVTFTSPGHGLSTGVLVRLYGLKGVIPNPNPTGLVKPPGGIFQVIVPDANTFQLVGCPINWQYLSGGFVALRTKSLSIIPNNEKAVTQVRISRANTGRPINVARARFRRRRS